jgi:multiple sugar transport system permease protein
MNAKLSSSSNTRAKFTNGFSKIIIYGLVICGAIITGLPFIWMILGSFKSHADFGHIPMLWFPTQWLTSNYSAIFQLMPFLRMYFNSTLVAVLTTIGVLITSAMAAYSFARIKFWGRDVVFLIYLGTIMVPGWVTIIPMFIIIKDFHWLNTYQGLIVPSLTSAMGTFLIRQFFLSIPKDFEDAAFIDGANRLQIFTQVILPMGKPALLTVGLITFMGNWNTLLWPLIIMTKPEMQTLPLGLARLALTAGWVRVEWGPLMGASLLTILPIAVIYAFLQSYFIRGITLSGLK